MWTEALKTASLRSNLGYFPCREGRLSPHLIHLTSFPLILLYLLLPLSNIPKNSLGEEVWSSITHAVGKQEYH